MPECPEEVWYLVEWVHALHGRSGASMAGLLPLSYTTIESWARLMDIELLPFEVEALIELDTALLTEQEPDGDEQPILTSPRPKWPTRKAPDGG